MTITIPIGWIYLLSAVTIWCVGVVIGMMLAGKLLLENEEK